MSEETITIDMSNPESVGRGLQMLNDNLVAAGKAVSTLATLLALAISLKESAQTANLTFTEALFVALDRADEMGEFSAPIVMTLRESLKAGCNAFPPPNGGTRLRIVQGEKKAA